MLRKRFRPEEITTEPREADVLFGPGEKVGETVEALRFANTSPRV